MQSRVLKSCAILTVILAAWLPVAVAEDAPAETAAADPNLEPLPIKLPEPTFSGTPLNYTSEILEISFKDRPPFLAPKGLKNVALNKPVTSSQKKKPFFGKLEMITDGKKEAEDENLVELKEGPQFVQIDLGAVHEIYAVLVWHFFAYDRVYFDVTVRIADDAEFTENMRTIFSNDHDNSSKLGVGKGKEYVEDYQGRLFPAKGEKAQFVRLYSNGNSNDEVNHYIEVEVFGRPAK